MKRAFSFRLERLRRVRAAEEDLSRSALLAAGSDLAESERKLAEIDARLAQSRAERIAARSGGTLDLGLDRLAEQLERELETKRHAAARRVVLAEQAYERARAELTERRRDRRVLDRLEESARSEHDREVAAADQAESDEASSARHDRGNRARGSSGRP